MTKQDARALLPKVGDVRMEVLTVPGHIENNPPEECVVVEVHPDHLYYRVRFTATGFHQCYKVPQTGRLAWEDEK